MQWKAPTAASLVALALLACGSLEQAAAEFPPVDLSVCGKTNPKQEPVGEDGAQAAYLTKPINVVVVVQCAPKTRVTLPAGSSVYLCNKHDGWQAIVFPREGDPVNCIGRDFESCERGWTEDERLEEVKEYFD